MSVRSITPSSSRGGLQRKASGILRSYVPPVSVLELSPISSMDANNPTDTLSLKCQCGYIKHDVMCLGDLVDKEAKLFHFCGGLFIIRENGAECSRCRKTAKSVAFSCAFCGRSSEIKITGKNYLERRTPDTIHSTVIYSYPEAEEEGTEDQTTKIYVTNTNTVDLEAGGNALPVTSPISTNFRSEGNICLENGGRVLASESLGKKQPRIQRTSDAELTGFRQFLRTLGVSMGTMLTLILLLLFFTTNSTVSLPVKPEAFAWPAPSHSVEGKFSKAAVTTDHGLCSAIGGEVLKQGGNAIDSAISVMFCLGVTNPQSSGLGGGFLLTLYNKTEGKCKAIDAREAAPGAATEDMFVGNSDGSKYGFTAAAVPGELAGYWYLYQNYGSGKVAWKDLVLPSAKLCRDGVPVSEYLDDVMKVKERHFRLFPSMKAWINPATNDTYHKGDLLPRPKLADTLELLAASQDPVELFYRGEMADVLAKEIKEGGGIITKEDFASYKVRVYDTPLVNDHFRGDLAMCGGPPPSSFAVTQLIISAMSKLYPEGHTEDIYSNPKAIHDYIETMKFGYAQRTLLGDHDFVPGALALAKNLTTPEYTQWVVDRMHPAAQPTASYGGINQTQVPDHGTSHVTVLDELGNGVSSTTTINRWFGAAVESEKYGIIYNDEMDDFSTPGTANGFGFAPSETNFIRPGKRPMSSMSPMIIYNKKTNEPRMVVGGSGGSKIISAVSKTVVRSLIFGDSMKKAIDAPMLHNQFTPDITQTDDRFPLELKSILEWKYGQKFRNTSGFEGIVQGIDVLPQGIFACGDYRRKTKQVPAGY